ncbi:MAG: PAS domain S-box protein, partial [Dehalococcoidales bacterium]
MSEDKSKKPLLADLKKLRQRVADLEAREIKRVQAEEALKQSEEYSSTILNHSPNPILVANPDTSIRYVNPALEKLTGYSMVELVGQKAPYPWWTEEA